MKVSGRLLLLAAFFLALAATAVAQGGNVIYGDLIVEDDGSGELRPLNYHLTLYSLNGYVVARQTIAPNGRYRFPDVADGDYDIVVEVENSEVARVRINVRSPIIKTDFKHDITLAWKTIHRQPMRPVSVTPDDFYQRLPANQRAFDKAQQATDRKDFNASITLLSQLVRIDPNDFQAWTELGTAFLANKNFGEAEKAYERSVGLRPRFFLALMNLGRVRLMERKFEAAIPILSRAVDARGTSAAANFYLGEAYLQIKKGSRAVGYFYEALRLDPVGRADAHLRLAALYNGAGLKQKAAIEYAEFLKKRPAYADKKRLEAYIAQNLKR
ncbi:MAG TPA: tetratricopeptide repeat protein [Pyrinomonadaceae bacterium]|nr:tetratricopeptide repeat protein [Pyrinomonadaceae bacterium]